MTSKEMLQIVDLLKAGRFEEAEEWARPHMKVVEVDIAKVYMIGDAMEKFEKLDE